MVPERMAKRIGVPLLAVALVAGVATHYGSGGSSGARPPQAASGTPAAPAPAATGPAGSQVPLPNEPDVGRAASGFTGQDIVYATHGFSAAEVAALTARVTGPVTAVYSTEQMVASGVAAYPDIAVDTMITDPAAYAAAPGDPALAGQLRGGLVLATDEAALRKVAVGDTIAFTSGPKVPVSAIVDAHVIGGHEMATATGVRPLPSGAAVDYLLVGGAPSVATLTATTHSVWPTRTVRVKDHTVNGYLSAADTVLTQLQIKVAFGEFESRPASGVAGAFVPDQAWVTGHLTSRRIVQLGDVTCNTAIIKDLTAAMQEVTDRGLASLIDTADFQYEGGCWSPRSARAIAGGTLSVHSWGTAIDINVKNNPLGGASHQDPRLVAIMAEHGFAWGGRFLRPDPAHFEWVGAALLR